jgi:hypothetical protein
MKYIDGLNRPGDTGKNMNDEQAKITALNEIVGIIDTKATEYKSEKFHMSEAKAIAGKKLINDLIKDAELLADSMSQKPFELINDLKRLKKSL